MSNDHADIFKALATAKPLTSYGERVKEGRHVLILKEYGTRETSERGTIIAADFIVEESAAHKPGSIVGCAWFISDRGWQGERELSRAAEFVKALVGTEDNVEAARSANALRVKAQPGRGIKIVGTGIKRKGDFVDVKWEHVAGQDGAAVAARRAKLEASDAPAATEPVAITPPAGASSLLGLLG